MAPNDAPARVVTVTSEHRHESSALTYTPAAYKQATRPRRHVMLHMPLTYIASVIDASNSDEYSPVLFIIQYAGTSTQRNVSALAASLAAAASYTVPPFTEREAGATLQQRCQRCIRSQALINDHAHEGATRRAVNGKAMHENSTNNSVARIASAPRIRRAGQQYGHRREQNSVRFCRRTFTARYR